MKTKIKMKVANTSKKPLNSIIIKSDKIYNFLSFKYLEVSIVIL